MKLSATILVALGANAWKAKDSADMQASNLTNCVNVETKCAVNFTHTSNRTRMVSDANECCDPTCILWTCGTGWKASPQYYDNIGATNKRCCDMTCSLVTCPSGQGTIPSMADQPGTKASECCANTCSQHRCYGAWTTDPSKSAVVNNTNEGCCRPSCQSVTCDASKGYVPDTTKSDSPGTTVAQCCLQTCKTMSLNASSCPTHYGVKEADATNLSLTIPSGSNATAKCCSPKCGAVTCPSKTIARKSMSNQFTDAVECCQATCATYTCPAGWAAVVANADNPTGASPTESCCERTCAFFNCRGELGSGWFNSSDTNKLTSTVQSFQDCCERSCANYSCPKTHTLRPSAETRLATSQNSCCEPSGCVNLRKNRTNMTADENCNKLNQSECEQKYWTFTSSSSVSTYVPCGFNDTYSLCRLADALMVTNCTL
eukprot:TRINITY_DN3408_c0_g1_i2.p1 TRINITY_DN3408_c0_g1~~TRINITY_DN3408_c0_g1_i2.p1  ORF type:complete len:431 (+),score=48.44 TRINITY_DN3408_c0_g1_i2:62-1354(+)